MTNFYSFEILLGIIFKNGWKGMKTYEFHFLQQQIQMILLVETSIIKLNKKRLTSND
jgi:hypothetical protein